MKINTQIGLGFIAMFLTAFALSMFDTYSSFHTDGNGIVFWSIIMGIGVGLAADLGY